MKKTDDTQTAIIVQQPIPETLEQNFMPYAMSVIISRAIPEIDGFKPSHRKLLYTMYKMGLLSGARTKSANIVGQTMKLNPHGELAIYDTMVRLARGNESLLHPFVDSKGNFGKVYSRDMACAASRYTEAKLDAIAAELFGAIDEDAVDFTDNYDGTTKEPALLPTTFPNLLVSPNIGMAVGMASNICSFNLREVCETAIARIQNPNHDLLSTLPAPDFSTGGELLYDRGALESVYRTGRGSVKVRAKWSYDKKENCIEITEIPYTTTIEAIIDRLADLIKSGKLREVATVRDESDKNGLKITIDLKRGAGADAERLMQRLFRQTPLMDSFSCNFNILIAGTPRVMGIGEILDEWTEWRVECVRRQLYFRLGKLKNRLHLLKGLKKILLDIDRAIAIIRGTEEDAEVIPNLMIGFGIDEVQAEYIAEIKLRNINKEYILKRIAEVDELEREIEKTEEILASKAKVKNLIVAELRAVAKKYGQDRKTAVVYETAKVEEEPEEQAEDYEVNLFMTEGGYFKKITPLSLRMGGEHRFKDGDRMQTTLAGSNRDELLFFTNRCRVYKRYAHEFEDSKASVLGDYLPVALGMEEGEMPVAMVDAGDFSGSLLFVFENGKAARVEMSCYSTKTNRQKLISAYSDKSPLVSIFHINEDCEVVLYATSGRALIVNTSMLTPKTTRDTQGVSVMNVKGRHKVERAALADATPVTNLARYRTRTLPAAGALLKEEDRGEEQLALETE